MSLNFKLGDIAKQKTHAIVNAANPSLAMGGGVCGAIFREAGISELSEACRRLAPVETGDAVITPGFNTCAKHIIHAVGPVYEADKDDICEKQLYSAYINSLRLAEENGCESISFPLLSAGIFGYPKQKALDIAVKAISDYLIDTSYDIDVYLVFRSVDSFPISSDLKNELDKCLDGIEPVGSTAGASQSFMFSDNACSRFSQKASIPYSGKHQRIDACESICEAALEEQEDIGNELFNRMDEPFSDSLLRIIDTKGLKDSDVYKKANIDRRLFSKIRTQDGYTPSKRTVLALIIALELNLDEASALLEKAGYALSHSRKFDVIVKYFIENRLYDIFQINEVLFKYDQPLLGS
ncbi:MAG: macro domain-containing protein [Lachnospiraceae bacterium]|nr:macro domain-containing protein [Lachnospiraceae bacterium]